MKPSIGRIVHYVLADGQHRAATVVNAWDSPSDHPHHCNLTVHLDGNNDLVCFYNVEDGEIVKAPDSYHCKPELRPGNAADWLPGVLIVGSASQDEDTKAPGTWHWPERVE